jgi:hypothetical protein
MKEEQEAAHLEARAVVRMAPPALLDQGRELRVLGRPDAEEGGVARQHGAAVVGADLDAAHLGERAAHLHTPSQPHARR